MPLSPVIVPPRAQASRRCETQAPLSGKPPSCAKRFGPLTPSARSGNLIVGDGTKNGLPAPNKEPPTTKNNHLTGKAPYKFESGLLQRGVRCELDPTASAQARRARPAARAARGRAGDLCRDDRQARGHGPNP